MSISSQTKERSAVSSWGRISGNIAMTTVISDVEQWLAIRPRAYQSVGKILTLAAPRSWVRFSKIRGALGIFLISGSAQERIPKPQRSNLIGSFQMDPHLLPEEKLA